MTMKFKEFLNRVEKGDETLYLSPQEVLVQSWLFGYLCGFYARGCAIVSLFSGNVGTYGMGWDSRCGMSTSVTPAE